MDPTGWYIYHINWEAKKTLLSLILFFLGHSIPSHHMTIEQRCYNVLTSFQRRSNVMCWLGIFKVGSKSKEN